MTTTPITQVSGGGRGSTTATSDMLLAWMSPDHLPLRKGLIDYSPDNLYVGGIEHWIDVFPH